MKFEKKRGTVHKSLWIYLPQMPCHWTASNRSPWRSMRSRSCRAAQRPSCLAARSSCWWGAGRSSARGDSGQGQTASSPSPWRSRSSHCRTTRRRRRCYRGCRQTPCWWAWGILRPASGWSTSSRATAWRNTFSRLSRWRLRPGCAADPSQRRYTWGIDVNLIMLLSAKQTNIP